MSKCEQCAEDWHESQISYCETCNAEVCILCAIRMHIKSPALREPHVVVYRETLEPVKPEDIDLCGKDNCNHFRKDHGPGGCAICARRIGSATDKDIANEIRCPTFIDQSKMADDDKFWKSFDRACAMNIKKELKKGEVQAFYAKQFVLQMLCQRWGWRHDRTDRMISSLIEDGKLKAVPTRLYDPDASKFEQCLIKLQDAI